MRKWKIRRLRQGCLFGVLALVIVGGSGFRGGVTVARASSGRVAVIVLENQAYTNIYQKAQAPYINSLISQGELLSNYTAITSGSLHDYLAMTSGLTAKVSPASANIFQAIDSTGGAVTWTSFQESMGSSCGGATTGNVPGTSTALYVHGHDAAYEYKANETCSTNDIPMTTATFNPASLPTFSFIIPNQCDDMHTLPASGQACPAYFGANTGGSKIEMGDNWLRNVVPQLLSQPDMTVIITWDEGTSTRGQHIVTLLVGAGVAPGSSDATAYNHYGLLAGLYAALGLGTPPNNAATSTPVPIP